MLSISYQVSMSSRGQESRPNQIRSPHDEVVLSVDLGNCSIVIQFKANVICWAITVNMATNTFGVFSCDIVDFFCGLSDKVNFILPIFLKTEPYGAHKYLHFKTFLNTKGTLMLSQINGVSLYSPCCENQKEIFRYVSSCVTAPFS